MTETFSKYVDTATPKAPSGGELITLTVGSTTYSATVAQVAAILLSQANTWTAPQTFSGALTANGVVSGTGITALFASPPAIGETLPNTGEFTIVTATVNTGIAPFTVTSTTQVQNLNVSALQGFSVGTSGATIPLLSTGNTWGGAQNFTGGFALGGNQVSFTGGSFTGTLTGATNVTFPPSGTLATTSGSSSNVSAAINAAIPDIGEDQLYGGTDMLGQTQAVYVGAGLTVDVDGSIGEDDTVDNLTRDAFPRLYVSGLPQICQNQLYGGTGSMGTAQPVSVGDGLGITASSLGTQTLAVVFSPFTELLSKWLS